RDLSLHLLRTQDEERRRIGREIHDSLGQYLSVLKMKLDSMSPGSPQEIGECSSLVEECVKEVRTISYLLYPPMLEEMGLKSAIPWYLEGFSKRSGIKTNFSPSIKFRWLSRDAEKIICRLSQATMRSSHCQSGNPTVKIGSLRTEYIATRC